jgi:tyrosine-protein phosphatase SIW14
MTIRFHRNGTFRIPFNDGFRAFVLLGLVTMLSVGCRNSSSLEAKQDESSRTSDTGLEEIPNFSKVCEGLYRGGQPTDSGYETLKQMGIRTIVMLRMLDRDSDELRQEGFQTYHISVKHVHPETEDVVEFLKIVTNPKNQPIFVHCREGVDRTGMMIALYRMVVQDWPRDKAIKEMKRKGFNDWNVPIERFLQNVDIESLKQKLAEHLASNQLDEYQRMQG